MQIYNNFLIPQHLVAKKQQKIFRIREGGCRDAPTFLILSKKDIVTKMSLCHF